MIIFLFSCMRDMTPSNDHFKGKGAIDHVAEIQARGIIASTEVHGIEVSGSISAGIDAAKETAIFLCLLHLILASWNFYSLSALFALTFGWLIWKTGRSAWLGWSRLNHLHRILEEERWEIEHNRPQEREELRVLYAAKGFQGKLLEDVVDVMMADGDRLLKIMVEEELGLSLEVHEHPLRQAIGAAVGVLLSAIFLLIGFFLWPQGGIFISSFLIFSFSSYLLSKFEKNQLIPTIIWPLAIAIFAIGSTYFLLAFLQAHWMGE
jgi:vacuolar iron transporter family protein